MAAVRACGATAVLSHSSAAALWGIARERRGVIEVSVAHDKKRRRPGIEIHHRQALSDADVACHEGIPVTSPVATLIDLATRLTRRELERAIGEADKLGRITPPALRRALDETPPRPGIKHLRQTLDRRTFRLTRSQLERYFMPVARRAGLGMPQTLQMMNGFEVDFYWPELGLVVECDGLTYHRTPAQQARDRIRDQAHTAAGLTPLRFTHEQVRYEPEYVERILRRVAVRLGAAA
jgi:very-short-patch-repair endonuclease